MVVSYFLENNVKQYRIQNNMYIFFGGGGGGVVEAHSTIFNLYGDVV